MQNVYLGIVFAPLASAIIAGLGGRLIGRSGAHWVTIIGVMVSFLLSLVVLKDFVLDGAQVYNGTLYRWATVGSISMQIGFLVDHLTALMISVVSFISLTVHVYTIGYMKEDPGYQRFFSYISLFTFAMLMLVMSNNFLQLFFGWEAVGLVSYLLIGFWYKRQTAILAGLKAFLINRVGDFGFILGIAVLLSSTGSLDYEQVFGHAERLSALSIEIFSGTEWSVLSLACICLFIGAMGKSAQIPLHVWLPDSMEGPTPISALIHAATMVTAGIFMVARMSPLFEYSETALSLVLVIGATTAVFAGLLGIVQHDIKRVIAYSTVSQLGYMTVALGASAYSAGIFHLATHAFFKALLFLAAGSVIIALHHEQDIRKMGGLRKYMPITYWTSLIGTLALVGFPGFSGFFSKDVLIEAVHASVATGAHYAYWCLLLGVFITGLYSFRMFFLVYHGEDRTGFPAKHIPKESSAVITVPLIILAVFSVIIGWLAIGPLLFENFFSDSLRVLDHHNVLRTVGAEFHGSGTFIVHSVMSSPVVYLASAGSLVAWFFYVKRPDLPSLVQKRAGLLYRVLINKYYFDYLNEVFLVPRARQLANVLWRVGDERLIDGSLVNGSARTVVLLSSFVRNLQSGYLYHYAFAMVIGLALLVGWMVLRG
ncbi:MAG: NADH-quinone oxidoreductase subunit L [Gammaproteobacteria bacterium]